MAHKKSLNRAVAEVVEAASAGRFAVRKNVERVGRMWADDRGASLHRWEYFSTVCPSEWLKKKRRGALDAITRAEKLFDAGWKFFRVVLAPNELPEPGASLDEQEARSLGFYAEVAAWVQRLNPRIAPYGASLLMRANHCAILDGRLSPHVHLLFACEADSDPEELRELVSLLFARTAVPAVVSPPPSWARAVVGSRAALVAHVRYLHGYPVAFYRTGAQPVKICSPDEVVLKIEEQPALFFAALSALAAPEFSLKGSVVTLGLLRNQRAPFAPAKNNLGPIRVSDFLGVLFPEGEPERPPAVPLCGFCLKTAAEAEVASVQAQRPPAPGVEQLDFLGVLFPVPARILARFEREVEAVEGLSRVTVLVEGCAGQSLLEIAEEFPDDGERWVATRGALSFYAHGHSAVDSIRLGTDVGRAWRLRVADRIEAKRARREALNLRLRFDREARQRRKWERLSDLARVRALAARAKAKRQFSEFVSRTVSEKPKKVAVAQWRPPEDTKKREREAWLAAELPKMFPAQAVKVLTQEEYARWDSQREETRLAWLAACAAKVDAARAARAVSVENVR